MKEHNKQTKPTKLDALKTAFKGELVLPDPQAEKIFGEIADRLLCLGVVR